MKKLQNLFYLILWTLSLISCRPAIKGEGNIVKEERDQQDFTKIELDLSANVTIFIADSFSVLVCAQPNLLEYIETNLEKSTLEIRSDRNIKGTKPIDIIITCPSLEALNINGSGDIKVINPFTTKEIRFEITGSGNIYANLNAETIQSEINGSGEIHLMGRSADHRLEINGSGDAYTADMEAEKCRVTINGSGDAEVYATSRLIAKIVGSGNITYSGQPELTTEITGSGEIKKKK